LLTERATEFTYREYTKDPLSEHEIREVLGQLGMTARDVLRARDAKTAGLSGDEDDDALIAAMAENPRLLQRPILITPKGAALGRPVENLEAVL
jgi:arsenate reductase